MRRPPRALPATGRDEARRRLAAAVELLGGEAVDLIEARRHACRAAALCLAERLTAAPLRARLDDRAAPLIERVRDLVADVPWTVDLLADAYQSHLEAPALADAAHARRRGGSYYTPAALVDAVLDDALDP